MTKTSHGGTGVFISDQINYKLREDLKIESDGNVESTFIKLIIPNKKNIIIGCIYRHPNSQISVNEFTTNYMNPLLTNISSEGKLCSLMGDFNIDLLKADNMDCISDFYNCMTSHFFAPYIMQPTRLMSKTLIDNIFINSIDYISFSGNITIQLSDHLFQFVTLQGFFKDLPKKINIYERNIKYFNEREFEEELNKMNWDSILHLDISDPNTSMDNLYNNLVYMLDEYAPYKKISKKEFKLKSKPWIDSEIRNKIYERDKLLKKYRKSKDENRKLTIYEDYKRTRNFVTNMKRDAKTKYYQQYFETYEWKSSKVWKGIKSIVKLNTTSKKDISLIDNKGFNVTDPSKIANLFNNYFVN